MAAPDIISITDYSATEPYGDPERFVVLPGDIDDVKNADPLADTVLGVTKMVFDRYMHWRFVHAIVLTMPDFEVFRKYYTQTLDICMQRIMDYYTLDHEVFMLNLIPYQIYKTEDAREIDADNSASMLKRWDFIDIGCVVRKNHKVTMEKHGDYLEVKELPDENSTTLKVVTDNQLVKVLRYATKGWYELVDGGFVPGEYITPYDIDIKKYVQIKCNGVGDAGLRGNAREIW